MKHFSYVSKLAFAFLLTFAFFGAKSTFAQICNLGGNAIVCSGNVLGHEQSGTLGTFTGTERWLALGQAPFGFPTPYGLRVQANSTTALFQVNQRTGPFPSFPIPYDAQINWGTVKTGKNAPPLARLDFDYTFQDQTTTGGPTVNNLNIVSFVGAFSKQFSPGGPTAICATTGGPCFGRVGIENSNPSYTLDVNGIVRTSGIIFSSDRRFKRDINTIGNSLEVLDQLRGTTYYFKDSEEFENFDFETEKQFGFIAQEVEEVLPELVYTDDDGYLAVDYVSVIPILVEGLKELQQDRKVMEDEIKSLQNELMKVKGLDPNSIENNLRGAELFQNVPNPTNGETSIRFFLPESASNAQMLVFDMNGGLVKEFNLNQRGESSIEVSVNELGAGMYLYSLIADGKEIDTKRMILTR